jgi:hypothetical protein
MLVFDRLVRPETVAKHKRRNCFSLIFIFLNKNKRRGYLQLSTIDGLNQLNLVFIVNKINMIKRIGATNTRSVLLLRKCPHRLKSYTEIGYS